MSDDDGVHQVPEIPEIPDDRDLRELVDLLETALDEAPAEPPPDRIAALRAAAAAARQTAEPAPRARHRWVLAAAAAAVGVLGGFVVGRVLVDGSSRPTSAGVVEYDGTLSGPAGEETDAVLIVVRTGIGRVIELDTDVLPILPAGEYYEVWFVAADGSDGTANRISAGTFHPDPDGRSAVRLAAAVDPARYPVVEITAEPGDGNPTATGPVVLRTTINGS